MRILISDLAPGTNYAIQMRATSNSNASEWSRIFYILTDSDQVKPNMPLNFAGTMSGTSFKYTWDVVTLSEDGTSAWDLDHYDVKIESSGSGNTSTFVTKDNKFELSLEQNATVFGTPQANVKASVQAVDKGGNKSTATSIVSLTNPAPAMPANFTAQALQDTINLRWDAVADTDLQDYRVYTGTTAGFTPSAGNLVERTSATSCVEFNVNYGADTFYKLAAVDVFGTPSTYATSGAVRPVSPFTVDSTPPGVPAGLAAVLTTAADTTTSAAVSWTAVTDTSNDLASYILGYRPVGAADWQYITLDYTVVSTRVDRLTPYVNYEFRVRSSDWAANLSAWSSTVTTNTAGTNTAPAAPTGIAIVAGKDNVTISWTENTEADVKNGAGVYEVQIATNVGFSTGLLTYRTGANSISINGLVTATTYHTRARAVDSLGVAGAYSSIVNATTGSFPLTPLTDGSVPAAAPTGVTATGGIGYILVSWAAVTNTDPVTYDVFMSTSTGFTTYDATTKIGEISGTSIFIENVVAGTPLLYGTTYYFKVRPRDRDGNGPVSSQASATPVKVVAADSTLTAADVGAPTTAAFNTTTTTANSALNTYVNEYSVAASETVAPVSGWSTTTPVRTPGTFIWFRTTVTRGDTTTSTTSPALLTGNAGAPSPDISLTATTQVLALPAGGGATTPATSVVTGVATNTTITAWTYSVDGAAFSASVPTGVSRTGNVVTITGATMTAKTISVKMDDAAGVTDTLTVAKVFDGATGATGGTGGTGAAGADAYTVLLTNESQSFAAGTTNALAGSATSTVIAYKGNVQQSATVGTITGGATGISAAVTNNGTTAPLITFTVTTALVTANGTFTIPVTVGGITFNQIFSWSLSFTGVQGTTGTAGAPASTVDLVATSQALISPAGGGATTPATSTITGTATNTSISTWTYSVDGAAFSGSLPAGVGIVGNVVTVTGSTMSAKTIAIRATGASGVTDTMTVAKVSDGATGATGGTGSTGSTGGTGPAGADGYTVLLSNESQTFSAGTTNANAGSATSTVIAYKGTVAQTATVGTITGGATGITAAVTNNGTTAPLITFTVTTALVTANGTFTVPVTVGGITFNQVFSWSLSFTGSQGITGTTGAAASTVDLVTTTQALMSPAAGGATTPTTAVITGTATNTTISTWTYSPDGGAFSGTLPNGVGIVGNVVTITGSTMTNKTIAVRATGASGVTDTMTVAKVFDGAAGATGGTGGTGPAGADAYTVLLTNEAQVFPGTVSAATAGSATTTVIAYKNTTQQTATIGTITGQVTGLTTAITSNGTTAPLVTVTVTTSLTTAGTLTIPVTVGGIVFTKLFSWTVGFTGATGAPGGTGGTGVGITSVTPYFATVTPSGAAAPAIPVVSPAVAPWTGTEPNYVANTDLYRTERVIYTNATFAYTTVTKVSSYAAAVTAQATADSKNKIFRSVSDASGTVGYVVNDLWWKIDGSNNVIKQWKFTGGAWTVELLDDGVFNTINANKIAAGTTFTQALFVKSTFTLGDAGTPGVIQSYNYVAGTTGFKLASSGLEIVDGIIDAKAIKANSSFITNLYIGTGGAIQSTGYTGGGTTGFQLSNTGLTIKGTNNVVAVEAVAAGTISAKTINIGVGGTLNIDSTGVIKSNNYSGTTTGYQLSNTGLIINDGDIDAKNLRTNTAIIGDLTIGRTADALGSVKSFGYVLNTTGFKLDKTGLEINSGSIAAAALKIQDSQNLMPVQYADFEFASGYYTNSTLFASVAPAVFSIGTTTPKFNKQYLSVSWPTLAPSPPYIFMATGWLDWNINLDAGTPYILSFYARATGSVATQMQATLRDSASVDYSVSATLPASSATWVRYSGVVTPANANGLLYFQGNTLTAGAGYQIDGIQIERKIGALTTPSPWKPPSSTSIDGGYIRTGEIRSNLTTVVNGVPQPNWSINMAGNAQFGSAIVRGSIVVGTAVDSDAAQSYIASGNFAQGVSGWKIDSAGAAEFNSGIFRGTLGAGVVTSDSMNAGAIDGMTITGANIRTSAYGSRFETNSAGSQYYNVPIRNLNAATIVASTGVFTTATHGLSVNSRVWFDTIVTTVGIINNAKYYVVTVPTATTFTVSDTVGGTPITLTNDGTANAFADGPDNLLINFPTDSDLKPTFYGDMVATGLSVLDSMDISGTANELAVGAQLTLVSSVTAPGSAPTVGLYYPYFSIPTSISIYPGTLSSAAFDGTNYVLLLQEDTGEPLYNGRNKAVKYSPSGVNLGSVNLGGDDSHSADKITVIPGGNYWVLGSRLGSTNLKISQYTPAGSLVSSIDLGAWSASKAIGNDGTNLLIAYTTATQVIIQVYSTAGTLLNTYTANHVLNVNLASVQVGTFDYGATRYVITPYQSVNAYTYTLSGSTLTNQVNETFSTQGGSVGLMWDGVHFQSCSSLTTAYKIYQLSKNKWTTESSKWWVSAAWYSKYQTISLNASTAGTITITFQGQTTAPIAWNASAATVQTAIEALSNVLPGEVVTSGGPFPALIKFSIGGGQGEYGNGYEHITPAPMTVNTSALTGTATVTAPAYKTVQSPRATFTMSKRSRPTVTSSPFPNASPVDSVMFYFGRGATDPGYTQMWNSAGASSSGIEYSDDVVFSGTNPSASNTFPVGVPAKIVSSAKRSDGITPMWTLSGNGELEGGVPVGSIIMHGGTVPAGWLTCGGQSLLVADYLNLYAVIGYTYGGSGLNFSMPNFGANFPRGNTPAANGGAATHTHTSDAHTHPLSMAGQARMTWLTTGKGLYMQRVASAAWTSSIEGITATPLATGSSTAQTTGAALFGATDSTTPAATGSTSSLPPYIGVLFIIKY